MCVPSSFSIEKMGSSFKARTDTNVDMYAFYVSVYIWCVQQEKVEFLFELNLNLKVSFYWLGSFNRPSVRTTQLIRLLLLLLLHYAPIIPYASVG